MKKYSKGISCLDIECSQGLVKLLQVVTIPIVLTSSRIPGKSVCEQNEPAG